MSSWWILFILYLWTPGLSWVKPFQSKPIQTLKFFFRECKPNDCPPQRDCGDICCEVGQVCRYLNGTRSCGPMVTRPSVCKGLDEPCGSGGLCCGLDKLCHAIPEDPSQL